MHLPILALLVAIPVVFSTETFPKPLTSKNFEETLSTGLHLVEFFSPYCHHCTDFAPKWQKTWEDFHSEGSRLGIYMNQVDCVESGDLCSAQKITGYPSLKLYGPKGFIRNYPKSYKRNQVDVTRFLKEQALELSDPNASAESRSVLITTERMIEVLAEPLQKPMLISLWPSANLGDDLSVVDPAKFVTPFDDEVVEFQRVWNIVTNQLNQEEVITGHFNCLSNKKICGELGINTKLPNLILVLPELVSGKVINYDSKKFGMAAQDIVPNIERIIEISKFKRTNVVDLIAPQKIVPHLPYLMEVPDSSETYFVFLYDEETVTPEDFEILPYLTEPLSKLPNTHLLVSNDTNIMALATLQKDSIYKIIEKNEAPLGVTREFNLQRTTIELLSSLPTIVCFKEYGLVTEVFHSYGPNHIRDQFKVIDWLREQATPYFTEFTRKKAKQILEGDGLLAIQVIDRNVEVPTREIFNTFTTGYHDYLDLRDEKTYQKIMNDRELKMNKVTKLKDANAKPEDIVKEISKEIPYSKSGKVQLVFLDVSNVGLLREYGWNIDNKEYVNGDVLIIEKKGRFYYDKNASGGKLTNIDNVVEFQRALSILEGIRPGSLKRNLKASPYGPSLRVLDHIHRFGVLGYSFVVALLAVLYSKARSGLRSKQKRNSAKLGILDDPDKFD